jgi:apolipoprotein N-acyltransferase
VPRVTAQKTPKRPLILVAFVLGVVGALSTPPFDWHFVIWPSLAGYACVVFAVPEPTSGSRVRRFLARMKPGMAYGFAINLFVIRFVVPTITHFTSISTPLAFVALLLVAFGQSIGWGVGSAVARSLANRGVPQYLAFAAGVYFAMFFPSLFPWTVAGGITRWPAFLQLAELIGERGVSSLFALTAGLIMTAVVPARARDFRPALAHGGLGLALFFGMWFEGRVRMGQIDALRAAAPHARITVLQAGTNALARWDEKLLPELLAKLNALTKNAEARGTDLTVWPESAYPYPLFHNGRRTPPGDVAVLGPGVHGPVLFGAFTRNMRTDGSEEGYNSALVAFGNGDLSEPYDKRKLLWFGETVPLADEIPWLRETFSRGTGLVPGAEVVRLDAGPIHAGVLICYEDAIVESGLDVMRVNPNVLVNVTNDAWFYGTSEGELHLRLSTLRTIELRRDMARAVNLGPTSMVDAAGRVKVAYANILPAAVPVDVALLDLPPTPFARLGHAPLTLAYVLACALPIWRGRKKKQATTLAS